MKLKHVAICLFAFATFAFSLNAIAENKAEKKKMSNSEKAKMILVKAGKTMQEMKGFSAKTETAPQGGTKMISTIYQRNNPDGTTFMRMEMGGASPMIFISNNDGYWYITGNTAIKMAYMTKMQAGAMAGVGQIPKTQKETKYSIKNGTINDIECFVVTSKLSEEQIKVAAEMAMQLISKEMKEMMKKLGQTIDMTTKIPVVTKLYIGKKDYFTYSTEQYNKNGQKLSQMSYTDVKLNISPEDKLFQIPTDMEVKIAKTVMDFSGIMIKANSLK